MCVVWCGEERRDGNLGHMWREAGGELIDKKKRNNENDVCSRFAKLSDNEHAVTAILLILFFVFTIYVLNIYSVPLITLCQHYISSLRVSSIFATARCSIDVCSCLARVRCLLVCSEYRRNSEIPGTK
jgi:hypothetical protein